MEPYFMQASVSGRKRPMVGDLRGTLMVDDSETAPLQRITFQGRTINT